MLNIKKTYLFIGAAAMSLAMSSGTALAATSSRNPHIAAFYTSGAHGVVGEPVLHTGLDIVLQRGSSGDFQQWFIGRDASGSDSDHSVWDISQNGSCPSGWTYVTDASASWGSYLTAGADYCVHTNG